MFLVEQLKHSIKEQKAVVIAGAGVSIAATGNQNASWNGLLRMGIERCVWVGSPRPKAGWETIMMNLVDIGDIDDWLLIAEQVQQRLAGGELVSLLEDWSAGLQTKNENIIRSLNNLNIPIMTTNYDTIIENITNRKSVCLHKKDYQEMIRAQDNHRDYVIHLHGCYKNPETIVFGIRSYDKFMEDEFKSFFIKLVPAFSSVIFVGCGGGLSDPNFSALKKWIRDNRQGVSIRHYRLLAKEEDGNIQPEARIVPLVYGEKYADLEMFLSGLTC